MTIAITLRSIAIVSLLSLVGCIAEQGGDELPTASTEQAAKPAACTAVCIEGYVFNPKTCECQAACTTTAYCVTGYTWNPLSCRCTRDR